jgi:DNA-binding response OmpR family regulator
MPKMDGLQMLRLLREDAWGKEAVVVLLTNLPGTEKVVEAVSLGAYEYLMKADRNLQDIVAVVKKRLRLD